MTTCIDCYWLCSELSINLMARNKYWQFSVSYLLKFQLLAGRNKYRQLACNDPLLNLQLGAKRFSQILIFLLKQLMLSLLMSSGVDSLSKLGKYLVGIFSRLLLSKDCYWIKKFYSNKFPYKWNIKLFRSIAQ